MEREPTLLFDVYAVDRNRLETVSDDDTTTSISGDGTVYAYEVLQHSHLRSSVPYKLLSPQAIDELRALLLLLQCDDRDHRSDTNTVVVDAYVTSGGRLISLLQTVLQPEDTLEELGNKWSYSE